MLTAAMLSLLSLAGCPSQNGMSGSGAKERAGGANGGNPAEVISGDALYARLVAAISASKRGAVIVDASAVSSLRLVVPDNAWADLMAEGLQDPTYASFTKISGVVNPDKVTIIRFDKNRAAYGYVILTRTGKVFSWGGGDAQTRPPWTAPAVLPKVGGEEESVEGDAKDAEAEPAVATDTDTAGDDAEPAPASAS